LSCRADRGTEDFFLTGLNASVVVGLGAAGIGYCLGEWIAKLL
jgi:hypothetical protein